MFPTTIVGSLPKPSWLAEPAPLWAPWRLSGDDLVRAQRDAALVVLKLQEDAGLDIVTDGEVFRQHFVHGILEHVDGVDFKIKKRIGIRNDRYEADCPRVMPHRAAPVDSRGGSRVHARPHGAQAEVHLPGR